MHLTASFHHTPFNNSTCFILKTAIFFVKHPKLFINHKLPFLSLYITNAKYCTTGCYHVKVANVTKGYQHLYI